MMMTGVMMVTGLTRSRREYFGVSVSHTCQLMLKLEVSRTDEQPFSEDTNNNSEGHLAFSKGSPHSKLLLITFNF